MTKQLFRSTKNRVVAGVCGGVGEYFDIDPNAIRLIYAVMTAFTGIFPGVVTYVLAILIVPARITMTVTEPMTEVKNEPTEI